MPLPLKVEEVRNENPTFNTYVFKHSLRSKPGQFIMVWLPGVDEVPMSVGWQTDEEFHVGISNAGDCTNAIFKQIKKGDRLGIRGPYGTSFELKDHYKEIVVIGGGYGTPPLLNLAQIARSKGIKVTAILGARSKELVLYEKIFEKLGCEVKVSTDDGSKGHKGFCTDILDDVVSEEKIDAVFTCGPEVMMVAVAKISAGADIDCQVSLERYMKCGFGICGQCCMDDSGDRVCKDGPVINGEYALKHKEFGKYTRTSSGKLKKY